MYCRNYTGTVPFVERFVTMCRYIWESPLSEVPLFNVYMCLCVLSCICLQVICT